MGPIFSILIATKNRIPYCINVIETILNLDDSDFELVVQDNSDTLDLKFYVQNNISDTRLKYCYTPPPFSSIDNFNAVITLASGEYLCLIGDDDGINPEIFKFVRWASQNNIDAILPGLNAVYRWPDACSTNKGSEDSNGELSISQITGRINECDTSKVVKKLMKNGGQDYLSLHFPKLYHGIVKKKYMDKIKEHTGNYVGGLSPDIYISVALTHFINKFIEIDYPLTIPGICGKCAPIDEMRTKYNKLEDAPHFRDRGSYSWSEQVPKFYSGLNIWADSSLASLRDMNRIELLDRFDVTVLTIMLLKRHKEYSEVILDNYFHHKNAINPFQKWFYLQILRLKTYQLILVNFSYRALNNRLSMKFKRMVISCLSFGRIKIVNPANYRNVENISKATQELNAHLLKHSLCIDVITKNQNTKYSNA